MANYDFSRKRGEVVSEEEKKQRKITYDFTKPKPGTESLFKPETVSPVTVDTKFEQLMQPEVSVAPAVPKESAYTRLDQKLGGFLPFGAAIPKYDNPLAQALEMSTPQAVKPSPAIDPEREWQEMVVQSMEQLSATQTAPKLSPFSSKTPLSEEEKWQMEENTLRFAEGMLGGRLLSGAAPIVKGGLKKAVDMVKRMPLWAKATGGAAGTAAAVDAGIGAFTPDKEDRDFLQSVGASVRAGVGDTLALAGGTAKWKGKEGLGEALETKGAEIRRGFEDVSRVPEEEISWRSFFNPDFYSGNVARSLPTMLALVPAMFAGYKLGGAAGAKAGLGAFGRAVLGSLTGAGVSRPLESAMEAGAAYSEALERGYEPDKAEEIAQSVFDKNLRMWGLDAAQLAAAFVPAPFKPVGKLGKVAMGAGRLGGVGVVEGLEESAQEVFQQQAFGDDRGFIEQMLHPTQAQKEAAFVGGVFGVGMGGAGVVTDVMREIKTRTLETMPPEMQTEVRHHAEHLERNEGLTADESIDRALETIAETEEGQKVIDQAVQGIVDDVNSGRLILPILGNIEPYSAPVVTEPVAAPVEPAAEVPASVSPVVTPTAALPEPAVATPAIVPEVTIPAPITPEPAGTAKVPEAVVHPAPVTPPAPVVESEPVTKAEAPTAPAEGKAIGKDVKQPKPAEAAKGPAPSPEFARTGEKVEIRVEVEPGKYKWEPATIERVVKNTKGEDLYEVRWNETVVRLNQDDVRPIKVDVTSKQKAPEAKTKQEPIPAEEKPTVVKRDRTTASTADLAADYKARGMSRQRAWSQFVIDKSLRPGIDAKEFYKVFDSVPLKLFKEVDVQGDVKATHILKETYTPERRVQILNETEGYVEWVDEHGTVGSTPREFIESLKSVSTEQETSTTNKKETRKRGFDKSPKEVLKEYGLQIVKTKDERDGRTAWQVKGKGARELKDVLKELGAKSINTSINEKAAWTFYGEEDPSVRILERVQQGATVTEPQSLEELQKQIIKASPGKIGKEKAEALGVLIRGVASYRGLDPDEYVRQRFRGVVLGGTPATDALLKRMAEDDKNMSMEPAAEDFTPPKKTIKAYKLFRTMKSQPGKIFPLFIGKSKPTPIGEWIEAEHIPTKGYAERPGWHAGILPYAPHLMKKDGTMQEGRVWAEVELPADVDWQPIADTTKTKDVRDRIPVGGHYRFKTNKMQGGAWIIGGAIKVNKILSPEEVREILKKGAPELLKTVEGVPVASVEFDEDARALIRALKAPDVAAMAHELGHVFRRDLSPGDLAIAEEWAGVEDGVWTQDAEEKFAEGFEKYLMDGKAPSPGLKQVFEKFKKWLTEIYKKLKNTQLSVELSDPMREVFDRLIGGKKLNVKLMGKTATAKTERGTAAEPEVELKQDAPHIQIANFAQEQLNNGERFNAFKLFDVATKAFQGKMSEGKYTPKDAYDAMELGVNMSILKSDINLDVGADEAKRNLARIERMLTLIPTQTKRTEEQDEFQQFSTPPNLAYVTAWVANIGKDDVVMEPSAGVGGLAVFAKKAGAKVVVNELSKRRLELLKELDFDHTFNENAEQIDNILPADIKPTVVIMNPPFSATAGRIKGKKSTKFSTAHIEQVLSRLEPNGRVVMIVGKGMADNAPSFRKWWDEIKQKYNVRVNIGINGKNYKKYGTSFDVQLVVIDNTGSTTEPTATGKFTDLEDAISFLEVIKNDRVRQVKQSISERAGEVAPEEGRGEARPGSIVPVSTPEVGIKEQRSEDRGRDKQGRVSRPPERDRDAIVPGRSEKSDEVPDGGKSSGVDTVGKTEGTEGRGGVPVRQDKVGADRGRLPGTDTGVKAEAKEVVAPKEELSNSVYSAYTPQKLKIPGAQKHPGPLVQSAAMAAVEPPTPTYTPNLPEEVVKYGKLSIAQLEAVVYAGQSHGQILPDGQRRGFFIGDGTGVGKGREISGIILDNMRQGRKKAVWISKNNELFKDAKRDFGNIGGDTDLLFPLKKIKLGTPIKQKGGILFTTYHTLASGLETTGEGAVLHKEGKKARIAQLVEWLGEDFDGVIAFDEAHFMQNSLSIKSKRGISKPATMALAGVELQRRLPNARVVYVSATGATEVHNLAYVDRLGLWGEGTAFADKNDFVNKIQAGGLAAMELVARDMKAMGVYIARSLSYEGVTYGTLEHKLTETQREIYDAMAKGWQIVLQNMHKALDITRQAYGGRAKGNAAAQFWSAQQRFFNQILTSMQMPSVIKQVEEDLKNGRAVVLQLVNTNEAIQNRAIAKLEDESLEDLDLTPRDILMQYLDKSFPTQQYEVYTDKDGNERTRPVIDSHGNQVHNREALAMKEELMSQIGALKVPDGPLELILNNFGPENVAEITGRRQRVIRVKDSSGRIVAKKESRTKSHVEADVDSFMNGKKQILVFSDAGGTGKSYHADLTAKNQRPRVHYLIQAGWRANNAVQGFGRTHRTNQASAPHYVLVTTNLKGQKRFISSIARRLDQLGALTKGQRQAGSQGLFSAKDNLESEIARGALWRFYMDLVDGQLKQLGDINAQELLRKMGMENLLDKHQNLKEDPALRDITKFLNRLLTLESDLQNRVFDAFWNVFEAIVEAARKRGDLDVGLENFRADKVEVKDEKTVYTEEKSGAETKYVELEASYKIEPLPFNEAIKLSRFNGFYRNTRSGRIYARRISGEKTLPNGDIVLIYELHGQSKDNVNTVDLPQFERGNWEKVDDAEAVKLWQEAQDKLPEYSTQKVHLITGALLPIWDRLTQERVRVIRVKTDSGRVMLGRIIPPRSIDETLRRLEVQRKTKEHSPGELVDLILNNDYTVYLANGWKISRRRVSGEHRIEVTGNDLYHYANQLEQEGVFRERINYATRFFIPAGDNATKILGNVIKHRPVLDVVAPRDEAQAMARPATSPKLKKKDATKETIRRRDIVKFLDSKFAPIRTGRFRRKSLGIFKIKPEVIRTRLANDLPVICHEVGHYLDKKLNLADPAYDQELLNLGEPQSKKSYTKEQVRKEGVAEFMRLYLTEPETAKQEAPNYYAAFENKIEVYDDIKDSLLTTRADIELWYTQPAAARVAGAISVGESNRRKMSLSSIYTLTIDELHPLKRYVEQIGAKNLPIHKDPFKLAWLARGWAGKARTLLNHGVLDANGKKIGKSLAEVLKPVSKELDDFRNYIVAKHSLEVTAQGKITGILDEDAQEVVDAAPDKYQKVLKDLVEYQDALMKLLVDSGVMSADAAKKMREMYPNYVPFYRVFEEDVNTIAAYMSKGGFANLRNPVKMMKGSTREILDPLESIVKNTYLFVNIAERNSVGRAIVELAESKEGSGRFVEKVDTRYNVAKDNILTIYRDGKAEKYQLEPDLYRATLMLDKDAANILVKILSYPASWLRAGATLSPDFMVRNPFRDQYSAFVNSKYGYIPGVDLIRGIFHYLKKDDLYWQFMNSGAASATLVSLDRDYLQKNVKELLKNKSKQEKILTALNPKEWANSFIEMLRELSEMGEYGTRIGEFAKGVRSGADPAEAALSARDVTLDFGRMGTHTKQANRIIAFMNATVQGMDKMRRQFIEKPLQTTLRAVISITLPSVLLFLANHDDDRYKELPQWQKDLFWIILTENNIYRIPKPFEMGILFGSVPERVLAWILENDPKAFDGIGETISEAALPGYIPTAMIPIIEAFANKSYFTGRPIVPQREEKLEPRYQYGPYTTETAKSIGNILNLSPRMIENFIRGYTGGLGMYSIKFAEGIGEVTGIMGDTSKPSLSASEYPVLKAFMAKEYISSQSVQDFYDELNELERKYATTNQTGKAHITLKEHARLKKLRKVAGKFSDIRKVEREILGSETLMPEQKKAALDRANLLMVNMAREALGRRKVQ